MCTCCVHTACTVYTAQTLQPNPTPNPNQLAWVASPSSKPSQWHASSLGPSSSRCCRACPSSAAYPPSTPPLPYPLQVLQGLSVFRGLTPRTLHAIAPLFEIRELIGGKSVFEEGDAGDAFFILVSGTVVVRKGEIVLATLKAEEGVTTKLTKELDANPFFGEMAILDAATRSASVHTAEPCKLLLIRADYGEERNGDRFRDFLHLVPDFKARLREIKKVRRQQTSLQEMMKVADAGARAAAEVHTELKVVRATHSNHPSPTRRLTSR